MWPDPTQEEELGSLATRDDAATGEDGHHTGPAGARLTPYTVLELPLAHVKHTHAGHEEKP